MWVADYVSYGLKACIFDEVEICGLQEARVKKMIVVPETIMI
jgi:hypothetical protein